MEGEKGGGWWDQVVVGMEPEGTLWAAGNILSVELGAGYIDGLVCDNSVNYTLAIHELFCSHIIF